MRGNASMKSNSGREPATKSNRQNSMPVALLQAVNRAAFGFSISVTPFAFREAESKCPDARYTLQSLRGLTARDWETKPLDIGIPTCRAKDWQSENRYSGSRNHQPSPNRLTTNPLTRESKLNQVAIVSW